MTDSRKVTAGYLNYRGDHTKSFDMTKPYGPKDVTNEMLWPLTIEYDSTKAITRVGFTYQMPPTMKGDAEEYAKTASKYVPGQVKHE